jgi:hypothetical protein
VWLELLQEGQQDGPAWLSALTEVHISFDAVMRVNCNHALVEAVAAVLDSRVEFAGIQHAFARRWNTPSNDELWRKALHVPHPC